MKSNCVGDPALSHRVYDLSIQRHQFLGFVLCLPVTHQAAQRQAQEGGDADGAQQPPAQRQMVDVGGQRGAVEQVAQVDYKGGGQQYQRRRAAGHELRADELGRPGEDHRRHGLGQQRRQPAGGGDGAEDQAERHDADENGQLGAHPGQELTPIERSHADWSR